MYRITKTLIVLTLALFVIPALAQPLPPAPTPTLPSYLFGGGGKDEANHGYFEAGVAMPTGLFNGTTNFPTYSYNACRFYRISFGKTATNGAAQCTAGLLFQFYEKDLLGFHVRLAVEGDAGFVATGSGNVTYTAGSKVVADVTRHADSKLGVFVVTEPGRLTGAQAGGAFPRIFGGLRFAFTKP